MVKGLEKICGYVFVGNECLSLLPKITAKIENGKNKEDTYLIGDSIFLSKKEVEHAIEVLNQHEREQFRFFTFGGGSFLAPGKSHPDSHNYASAADFVCRFGSPNLQLLALERYYERKKGLNDDQIIAQLALKDAMLYLDSLDIRVMETYIKQRIKHYEHEFSRISNLTILDPDLGSNWKHEFKSECYQKEIQKLVEKYQNVKQVK